MWDELGSLFFTNEATIDTQRERNISLNNKSYINFKLKFDKKIQRKLKWVFENLKIILQFDA